MLTPKRVAQRTNARARPNSAVTMALSPSPLPRWRSLRSCQPGSIWVTSANCAAAVFARSTRWVTTSSARRLAYQTSTETAITSRPLGHREAPAARPPRR